jgi:hypothetical protein
MKLFGFRLVAQSTIDAEVSAAIEDHKWKTVAAATEAFRANGYSEWCGMAGGMNFPPDGQFYLIRPGWPLPILTSRRDMSPYANINGLFWKSVEEVKNV